MFSAFNPWVLVPIVVILIALRYGRYRTRAMLQSLFYQMIIWIMIGFAAVIASGDVVVLEFIWWMQWVLLAFTAICVLTVLFNPAVKAR